jgi:hypothetical protein
MIEFLAVKWHGPSCGRAEGSMACRKIYEALNAWFV